MRTNYSVTKVTMNRLGNLIWNAIMNSINKLSNEC